MQRRIELIEEKRKAEKIEKDKLEKMSKKEQERFKNKSHNYNDAMKKKKKSTIEEERDAHEAYQLILSEYHRRVKTRTKQKIMTIHMLTKPKAETEATPETTETEKGGTQGLLLMLLKYIYITCVI